MHEGHNSHMIVVGRRIMRDGKIGVGVIFTDDPDTIPPDEGKCYPMSKPVRRWALGCLYSVSVEMREGRRMLTTDGQDGPRLIRQVGTLAQRAQWSAEDEASVAIAAHRRREGKYANLFPMGQCLDPLREAYERTDSNGRIALEIAVVRYLRTGK